MNQTQVAEFIGVCQQTVSYWLQTDVLRVPGRGHGRESDFSPADVMRALTVKELRNAGASLEEVRKAVRALEDLHDVSDWQNEWLLVEPDTGDIAWYDTSREAMLRLRDSQAYLVDVFGIRERVEKEIIGQNEEQSVKS